MAIKTNHSRGRNGQNARKWTFEVLGGAILSLESYGYTITPGVIWKDGKLGQGMDNFPGRYNKVISDMGFDPEQIRKGYRMLPDSEHVRPEELELFLSEANGFKER